MRRSRRGRGKGGETGRGVGSAGAGKGRERGCVEEGNLRDDRKKSLGTEKTKERREDTE